jgi:orotidine-5'-phosphate decarboxylase
MQAKERIACAIDVDNAERAIQLVRDLRDSVGVFKIGLELLSAEGPSVLDRIRDAGARRIFYDAKLFDIPNTVAGAMRGIAAWHPWCVTVHATGGREILEAAVKTAAAANGSDRTKIIAVTLLTSISAETLRDQVGMTGSVEECVVRLALLARASGCDGVVSSPREIAAIRAAIPDPEFLIITPGVRPAGSDIGDQARVTTPAEAIRLGASMLVIGRPITAAADPVEAAARIEQEIASL